LIAIIGRLIAKAKRRTNLQILPTRVKSTVIFSMANSVTCIFYIQRTLFLLCMLISTQLQANASWDSESSRILQEWLTSNPERLPELDDPVILDFYRARQYTPLWSDTNGRLNRAYDLFQTIEDAADEGLEPADYYQTEIREYWNAVDLVETVRLDLILTAALHSYSRQVHSGRFNSIETEWHIKNTPLDSRRLFDDVARHKLITQLLKNLPPPHSGYQLLKKQLHHYREIAHDGGWNIIEPGPVLESGIQHKQVLQLRQRLEISNDLVESNMSEMDIFNTGLKQAVIRYQQRHGLKADGRVGPVTRQSLNIPVQEKIRQIRINMERWRWMPRNLGKRYLVVNMTGFELYIMNRGSTVLDMPVIIGKAYRSTPSFSGLISVMEYNPYWTIPTSIALQDFIPRQVNDPDFFQKKSIRLFRGWGENAREIDPHQVNWRKLDKENFPYWLRQDPGPKNALGQVKFLFSNPYEIYLHGTPDQHLFDRVVRTFSSGCIRVKDPVKLAAYLLNDGTQQMEEEVLTNIHLGSNQSIVLPVAVPIYLVYWTVWVDPQGRVNFRDDIYHRDSQLHKLFDA
jgi:murein L,D-transpeptidase YcbB/YkuD